MTMKRQNDKTVLSLRLNVTRTTVDVYLFLAVFCFVKDGAS